MTRIRTTRTWASSSSATYSRTRHAATPINRSASSPMRGGRRWIRRTNTAENRKNKDKLQKLFALRQREIEHLPTLARGKFPVRDLAVRAQANGGGRGFSFARRHLHAVRMISLRGINEFRGRGDRLAMCIEHRELRECLRFRLAPVHSRDVPARRC